MLWSALWGLVTAVGLLGLLVSINSLRFARKVAGNAAELWASELPPPPADGDPWSNLPAPVSAYLTQALGETPRSIRSVRFRHGGRFRTKLDGPWQPIRGEQYNSAAPPGFVWWGRLRAAPGVWIDARDRALGGVGNMLVSLESMFTLFDRSGTELDQGAMLRLLSDFVLFPTAMLDGRYMTWQAVDARHARATLRVNATEVTGTFEFGDDGLPGSFSAHRYLDSGQGPPRLLPWSGTYEDYRKVDGLLVPHHFIGYWHVDGRRIAYADFQLETPEYDVPRAF